MWHHNDGDQGTYILLHKIMCSDKYWWMSRKSMPRGEYLYEPEFVLKSMENMQKLIAEIKNEEKRNELSAKYTRLVNLIRDKNESY
jgi:hypothetical protein